MNIDDLFSLKGKIALVTGGSKGLGRSMALALASAGADVAVSSRHLAEVEVVAREIIEKGRRSVAIQANMAKLSEIGELTQRASEALGNIDILVNNAGVGISRSAVDISDKEWNLVLNVNLKGSLFCAKSVAAGMIKRGHGRIINMCSVASSVGSLHLAPYTASKHALLGLTKTLALEWAGTGVTVNCICPGFFDTPMTAPLRENSRYYEAAMAMTPMHRMGRPEELDTAVVFLASQASSFVTGVAITVDGGYTAQ
jgi:2-dehydro-3-deoxy-D-gluconate 5-dehydrogenase